MNPENKNFIIDMINRYPVSVISFDDEIMFTICLPDGRPLYISSDITLTYEKNAVVVYSIGIGDEVLEYTMIDTANKLNDQTARDIIELMRICNTKIILQSANLANSKFMIHKIDNQKIKN